MSIHDTNFYAHATKDELQEAISGGKLEVASTITLVAAYARAITVEGVSSPIARQIRLKHQENADFAKYADLFISGVRQIIGLKIP